MLTLVRPCRRRLLLAALAASGTAGLANGGCIAEHTRQECRDLVELICENSTDCIPREQCDEEMRSHVDCERVKDRSRDYPQCKAIVQDSTCAIEQMKRSSVCSSLFFYAPQRY